MKHLGIFKAISVERGVTAYIFNRHKSKITFRFFKKKGESEPATKSFIISAIKLLSLIAKLFLLNDNSSQISTSHAAMPPTVFRFIKSI